ncbi:MAG TPA: TonB-dependent receptor [Gammaproteobacteria bacterium]
MVRRTPVAVACYLAFGAPGLAQEPEQLVEVIGRTPLGADIAVNQIAANVQRVTAEEIASQHALDLTQFMQRNLGSVLVNEAQNNPLQPDLQYRGFVGSPLLGLPQGIAVYQDGVRLNEPFGDTVSWALLPDSAIDSMVVMPGSNPLFGLNALGGAISIRTKDGFAHPGTEAEIFGGSFGRWGLSASTGGSRDDFGYFVTAEYLDEDGWRDFSPTEAVQLFGKLSWEMQATRIDLGLGLAETDLIGNGPAPAQLLALDREAIFTRPDITENELGLINLSVEHRVRDSFTLSGNVYLRSSDIASLNGDDSEYEACEDDPGFICEEDDDEEPVLDANGAPVVFDAALEGGAINRTETRQDGAGFALQGSWRAEPGGRENLFLAGLSYDDSSISFSASTELGALDATRLAVPGGVFVGDAFTRLDADNSNFGIYASNTLALRERVSLTVSGRFNETEVTLRDRLGTALNGDHSFDRFNFALGLTAGLSDQISVYAGFDQSSRAPSPVELTCADEDDPCRLPNAFLADPPLEQVVAETYEFGVRGLVRTTEWHAGFFRTTSRDDILFISAGALTGQGYFDNVGRTRREGIELNLAGGEDGSFRWFANYTFLDATFREYLTFPSPHNPAAFEGEVFVRPGDRLPLIPEQLLKAGFERDLGDRVSIGADVYASSDFHLRGDEGNNFTQTGRTATLNLRASFDVADDVTVFLKVDNALDREYETFGQFGEPDEVLGDEFDDPRFLSPAAPRAAWIGVRVRLPD